jgi:hypothetical protein
LGGIPTISQRPEEKMSFFVCDNCNVKLWEDEIGEDRTMSGNRIFCPECHTGWLELRGIGVKPKP